MCCWEVISSEAAEATSDVTTSVSSIDVVTSSSIAVAAGVISITFAVWKIISSLSQKKYVRYHLTVFFSRMIFEYLPMKATNNHPLISHFNILSATRNKNFTFIDFNFTLKNTCDSCKSCTISARPLLAAISRGLLSNYKTIKCVSSLVSIRGLLIRDMFYQPFLFAYIMDTLSSTLTSTYL